MDLEENERETRGRERERVTDGEIKVVTLTS